MLTTCDLVRSLKAIKRWASEPSAAIVKKRKAEATCIARNETGGRQASLNEDTRLELGGGILTLGVMIDGEFYLLCTKTSLGQTQEMEAEPDTYIQGGDFTSIVNIGPKKIEGTLTFPLLLEGDGTVNPSVRRMLDLAQHPNEPFAIDTNFTFSHLGLTAESEATDNNRLVSLDCCTIQKLSLSCQEKGKVEVSVTILGMIDLRADSAFVDVPDAFIQNANLRRAPDWRDCDAFRENSELRGVTGVSIDIENKLDTKSFILPIEATQADRTDQISLIIPHGRKWSGSYTERVPRRWGRESYVHGGWMVGQNLILAFGPVEATVEHPFFETAPQEATSSQNERSVKFTAINTPAYRGALFQFFDSDGTPV